MTVADDKVFIGSFNLDRVMEAMTKPQHSGK